MQELKEEIKELKGEIEELSARLAAIVNSIHVNLNSEIVLNAKIRALSERMVVLEDLI